MITLTKELISKYDEAGPRYTSYPTAPVWNSDFDSSKYVDTLEKFSRNPKPLSLYVHIPFCQKRCLYCACNVLIRKPNPAVGEDYIRYLGIEMELIKNRLGFKPTIQQIHIGGGTPTFLTDDQLSKLCLLLDQTFDMQTVQEKSIEVDPRSVDSKRIQTLHRLGFNRLSFGIQDFDEQVQQAVGRRQLFSDVQTLFEAARSCGFTSINCDLIYGLPSQTILRFGETIKKILDLNPDRIALYSFAHVPWIHSHQKLLNQNNFPSSDEKISLFLHARDQLLMNGYTAIAMDHFALEKDELSVAYREGRLKRNFMGYTTLTTQNYLGLGVSSIGYLSNSFSQNTKDLKTYYTNLDKGFFPVEKGYVLSKKDLINQWVISSLMCQFQIDKKKFKAAFKEEFDTYFNSKSVFLDSCENEHLIKHQKHMILVTELGRLFVRNICMRFDEYLSKNKKISQFSRTV